jgi:indolepyruvate ferredoxin oxidoreductase
LLKHNRLSTDFTMNWDYRDPDGKAGSVRVSGRYACDNWEVLREWALAGLGVALKSTWDVRRHLEDGSLVSLLPRYTFASEVAIYAVYPHRRHLPAKTRAFAEFLPSLSVLSHTGTARRKIAEAANQGARGCLVTMDLAKQASKTNTLPSGRVFLLHAGADPPDDAAARTRRASRAEYRRFRFGYRVAARRLRPDALAGEGSPERSHSASTGLNEDLAATAIWGTQQLNLFPGAKYDGVFSMWYGKGPNVDRCGDVFKHANAAGTSRHGGVLVLAGDDHGAKSSTLPHQSEHIFKACLIGAQSVQRAGLPRPRPARLRDEPLLRAGCWSPSCVTDIVESGASLKRIQTDSGKIPQDFHLPSRRAEHPLARRHPRAGSAHPRLEGLRALAYTRANGLDRIVLDSPARLGIVTTGKSFGDVMQALADLGITGKVARTSGFGSARSRCPGRSSRPARVASPKGWKRSWWSRRSGS